MNHLLYQWTTRVFVQRKVKFRALNISDQHRIKNEEIKSTMPPQVFGKYLLPYEKKEFKTEKRNI